VRRRLFEGAPEDVAVALLGCRLVGNGVVARLMDVEAYGGATDPASHAYRGERVANRSMFGPAAHLYVYLSYGIHSCANVVCGPPGVATAVLLRSALVLEGVDVATQRRGRALPHDRLDGPGRLCQGMGITRDDDGVDLLDPDSKLRIVGGSLTGAERVVAAPRVGLTKEVERPWRFFVVDDRPKSAPRRRPGGPNGREA
jgi:DNA-3-methyladenine glycosylase